MPITDVTWQWARSMDMTTWEDIGNPTPSGSRNPTTDDEGYHLRATAMYTDSFGSGKTASVVSENAVEERTVANAQPNFSDLDDNDEIDGVQVTRSVDEGIKGAQVGKPTTAMDDDTALLYELEDPDDQDQVDPTDFFSINSRTAQITTDEELDSNSDGQDSDTAEDTYTVEDASVQGLTPDRWAVAAVQCHSATSRTGFSGRSTSAATWSGTRSAPWIP